MKIKTIPLLALVTFGLLFFTCPAYAAINTIPAGGTVFLGEQGLDISGITGTAPVDIGWWASGAAISMTSPDVIISVTDPRNFYVSPSGFGSQTGAWYLLPGKTVVFNVADPRLAVRVEDTTVSVDVTNRWVPTGDEVQFVIDSNLGPITQRGAGSTPITIKVQSPDGGTYTSLFNKAGSEKTLVNLPVDTTPYYTGAIWDTGRASTYPPGTYTIWAECNVNAMNDNYNAVGKTNSQRVSLLNQDQNPLIRGNLPVTTTVATTTTIPITTKITTSPVTSVPVTTIPPTVQSPVLTPTKEVPVTSSVTPLPQETQSPTPTKSPGFEGILAGISVILSIVLFSRKD